MSKITELSQLFTIFPDDKKGILLINWDLHTCRLRWRIEYIILDDYQWVKQSSWVIKCRVRLVQTIKVSPTVHGAIYPNIQSQKKMTRTVLGSSHSRGICPARNTGASWQRVEATSPRSRAPEVRGAAAGGSSPSGTSATMTRGSRGPGSRTMTTSEWCPGWTWLTGNTAPGNPSEVSTYDIHVRHSQYLVFDLDHSQMFMTLDPKRMAKLCHGLDKHLLHGIKQFNLDPDRGLEILVERGYVEMTAESLASFLLNQERLSKKQIGNTSTRLRIYKTLFM